MNKKSLLQRLVFVSIVIINISTIVNGVRHHENGWVIAGSISLALIITAVIRNVINAYRDKAAL
jgi:hypothetical protein